MMQFSFENFHHKKVTGKYMLSPKFIISAEKGNTVSKGYRDWDNHILGNGPAIL